MHQEGTAMEYFAGVCVVDRTGQIVSERKMGSEPEALVALFRDLGLHSRGLVWWRVRYRSGCMLV
jgi:hypothetical protein